MKIGILALQGNFESHNKVLEKTGVETVFVKKPEHLNGISGLVLPGGESTTNILLLKQTGLDNAIKDINKKQIPLFGTCAGLILLAKELDNINQFSFGFLSIKVERNAYGSQKNSFEIELEIPLLGDEKFPCIFIRAPKIKNVSANVEIIAKYKEAPILIKENNILGASFHPELTQDPRIHSMFLDMCNRSKPYG